MTPPDDSKTAEIYVEVRNTTMELSSVTIVIPCLHDNSIFADVGKEKDG